jgi:hypothetical protein
MDKLFFSKPGIYILLLEFFLKKKEKKRKKKPYVGIRE